MPVYLRNEKQKAENILYGLFQKRSDMKAIAKAPKAHRMYVRTHSKYNQNLSYITYMTCVSVYVRMCEWEGGHICYCAL